MTRQFETDSHFIIGHDHVKKGQPCQDYAQADVKNGRAYAIVSDGCSSGGRTNIGACMLTLATVSAILQYWEAQQPITQQTPHEIDVRQESILKILKPALKLETEDMLATCSFAMVSPDVGLIHTWGDGMVAYKLRNGSMVITRFVWAENMPLYLAYADDHYASFIKEHGGDLTATRLTAERWEYHPQQQFLQLDSQAYTLAEGIQGITTLLTSEQLAEVEFLAVFSDGPDQFDQYDWKEVVVNLLAFKTSEGEFAKRRMNAFVKQAQKTTQGPLDDLSYAVIRLIDPDRENEEDAS